MAASSCIFCLEGRKKVLSLCFHPKHPTGLNHLLTLVAVRSQQSGLLVWPCKSHMHPASLKHQHVDCLYPGVTHLNLLSFWSPDGCLLYSRACRHGLLPCLSSSCARSWCRSWPGWVPCRQRSRWEQRQQQIVQTAAAEQQQTLKHCAPAVGAEAAVLCAQGTALQPVNSAVGTVSNACKAEVCNLFGSLC
jgi:hypothetical protein